MRKLFSKYKNIRKAIIEGIPYDQDLIWYLLLSFLLGILIFSGPIAIVINTLIFNDILYLMVSILGILVGSVLTVSKILFYKIAVKKKIENIVFYYIFDWIFYTVIIVAVLLFIF